MYPAFENDWAMVAPAGRQVAQVCGGSIINHWLLVKG